MLQYHSVSSHVDRASGSSILAQPHHENEASYSLFRTAMRRRGWPPLPGRSGPEHRSAAAIGCRRPALGFWRREERSGRTAHDCSAHSKPCNSTEKEFTKCECKHIFVINSTIVGAYFSLTGGGANEVPELWWQPVGAEAHF